MEVQIKSLPIFRKYTSDNPKKPSEYKLGVVKALFSGRLEKFKFLDSYKS